MLPKINRLNIRTYFKEIRGTGRKLTTSYYSFYYRISSECSSPQINIVVSKKVAKSAVKRNRMRRSINAIMRKLIPDIDQSLQGLFFVYKDFSSIKSTELEKIVHKMCESVRITK